MAGPWDATRGFRPAHERADVPWYAREEAAAPPFYAERHAREPEPAVTKGVETQPPRAPAAGPFPMPQAELPAGVALTARVRARLRAPDGLREAFVVKEILDRPVALRRGRNR